MSKIMTLQKPPQHCHCYGSPGEAFFLLLSHFHFYNATLTSSITKDLPFDIGLTFDDPWNDPDFLLFTWLQMECKLSAFRWP
jgi:hypothetical protein